MEETLTEVLQNEEEINDINSLARAKPSNPYNYDALALGKRTKALKDAVRDNPHLPIGWIELVYDYLENADPEEVDKVINKEIWTEKPKERDKPGIYKTCSILDCGGNVIFS